MNKTCRNCNNDLPASAFYKHPTSKDGLKSSCRDCYNKQYRYNQKKYYAARKQKNCCVCCSVPAKFGIYCEKHLLMDISKNRLGTKKKWQEIKQLLIEQKNVCAYSGQKIALGRNASLEHKIPSNRGGTNELSNICWIDLHVNKAKGAMTYQEFYEFIHTLAKQLKKP